MDYCVGWLGTTLLGCCGLPQALKTYRTRSAADLSWLFLWMWFWGEIFTLTYIVATNCKIGIYQWPLYLNYGLNLSIVVYLLYAKAFYPPTGSDAGAIVG